MSNPGSESAYEEFKDMNKDELMEEYINSDKLSDKMIVEFLLDDAELFTMFTDKFCDKYPDKLRDFYFSSLPDGPEPDEEEDRLESL